ncbi:MAG: radical SAM protein [Minisyncoccia bacterium]
MPDIAIWNKCNNHCVMCTNPLSFQLDDSTPYSFEYITERWKNKNLKPNDVLCLTGGEPTMHPDFLKLLNWFRVNFPLFPIAIASNGRLFSYHNFAKRVLKINNLILEIAIHGYNEQTHDRVTRTKGSFNQTIKGLHNILKYKNNTQEIEIRIIITKLTYKYIDKILHFLQKEFPIKDIRDIAIIFEEMEGQAKDNFKEVGISYSKVKNYIIKALEDPIVMNFNEIRLYHFPLCVLPSKFWPYIWRTLRGEEITYVSQCDKCVVKKYCLGIHRDYIALIGKKEFKPIKNIKIKTNKNFYHPIGGVK